MALLKANRCFGRKRSNRRVVSEVDGTYAWVVAIASFFAHVILYGVTWSSGVFYELFRHTFDVESWVVALIATLSTAFMFGFCPITGLLINRFGHRTTTVLGGVIAGTGLVLSAYATNINYLITSFGVITGVGFGLAYLGSISIVPLYFEKWRTVALGFAVSGVGTGTFIVPPLIRYLVHLYGMRGCLLIIGGITYNICLCGILMRPPRIPAKILIKTADITPSSSVVSSSSAYSTENETSDSYASPLEEKTILPPSNTNQKRKKFLDLLNLQIFKNVSYIAFCLNNFLVIFGISIFYVHVVAFAETKHVTADIAALLVSVLGISNFLGRLVYGFLGKLPWFDVLSAYIISSIFTGVVTLFLPMTQGLTDLAVIAALFGFMSACIGPYIPELITQFLDLSLIPSAYGYLLVFEALGSLLGPPVAGYLFEYFHMYAASFYLCGSVLISSGLVMIVPWVLRCCKRKRRHRRDSFLNVEIEGSSGRDEPVAV